MDNSQIDYSQIDDLDYFYRKLVRACQNESKDGIERAKRRFDQFLDSFILYTLTKRNLNENA